MNHCLRTSRRSSIDRRLCTGSGVVGRGLLVVTLAVACAAGSRAQQAASPTAEDALAEVIITSTRISRQGFESPTPTTIVDLEQIENRSPVTLSDVLFDLPAVKPAPSPSVVSQAGGNFINLRGLGNNRTLVLVDDRRFVPSSNAGVVDTNVVPTALVERVDIVTGGASAAWGSDAVAGVVNIVLRKKLDGIQGDVQYGESQYRDAKNATASLAAGTGFADGRGQVMAAIESSDYFDLPNQGDRTWSDGQCAFDASKTRPVNGVIYARVPVCGLTLSGYTNGGVIVAANAAPLAPSSPLYGKQFLNSSSSAPYQYGTLLGNSVMIGGQGGWISNSATLQAPVQRGSLYARSTYDFTSNLQGFVEGSYSSTMTNFDVFNNSVPSSTDSAIQIQRGNPYIPGDIQTILAANPAIGSFYVGRLLPEFGALHTDSKNEVSRVAFGLNGSFDKTWQWNLYGTHGRTLFITDYGNDLVESNFRAALDVVINPATGKPDCRINVSGPAAAGTPEYGAAAGCVPANPFGAGSLASAAAYVDGDLGNVVTYMQDAGGASIQGEPFNDWAGPISIASGVEYRKESLNQVVSPYSNFLNPPAFAAGGYQQANPKSFSGSNNVKEVFGETVIPLLSQQRFAEKLDLNGAVRETDYSNSGSVTTWKVGVTYEPLKGLLFRGTRSRDIRAASLLEQSSLAVTYGPVIDRAPGAGGASSNFIALSVGNHNLTPEVADTTTYGFTWSNLLVEGLSISGDAYRINLAKEIGQLGSQGIMDTCYGQGTAAGLAPNPASCALINRASNLITNEYLNLGTIYTTGFDYEASYRLPLTRLSSRFGGTLTVRLLANNVTHLQFDNNGLKTYELAGDNGAAPLAGTPKWRGTLSATYDLGPMTAYVQSRVISTMDRDVTLPGTTAFLDRNIPSITYVDASLRYRVRDRETSRVELYATVNNLMNKAPPFVPSSSSGLTAANAGQLGLVTNAAYYDVIGRAFVVGGRFAFY